MSNLREKSDYAHWGKKEATKYEKEVNVNVYLYRECTISEQGEIQNL